LQEKLCGGPPYVFTYVDNYRIIGPGPDNDFVYHVNYHTTINTQGEVTTDKANSKVDCK
jgi:hypothetical protein